MAHSAQASSTISGTPASRPCTNAARSPSPSAPEGSTAARCDSPTGSWLRGTITPPRASSATQSRLATARTPSARSGPASSSARATKAQLPTTANTAPQTNPAQTGCQPRASPRPPMTTSCSVSTASTAMPLAPSRPPRPSGLTPSRRSTPYRRSKPVAMAWAVKAEEMTHRASTPGTARSIRRPGPSEGTEVSARPSRAAQGSTSATSSCSPLRSSVPVSKRAWAGHAASRRVRLRSSGALPGQGEVGVLEAARRR